MAQKTAPPLSSALLNKKLQRDKEMPRHYIDEHRIIIALDTNVIRELCYNEPSWLPIFEEMSKHEYDFCLADHLFAEFLNQLQRASISEGEYQRAIKNLSTFISSRLPILPGNRELFGMCGCLKKESQFNPDETHSFCHATYKLLSSAKNIDDMLKSIEVSYGKKRVKIFLKNSEQIQETIDEERNRWIEEIKSHDSFSEKELDDNKTELITTITDLLDKEIECDPPLSIRLDVAIRHKYRQIKIANRLRTPYNPESKKKINDGIDYNMDFVFMLPAILCTSDDNYYKVIKDLNSFQSQWAYKPDEMSDAWKDKTLTVPSWAQFSG